MNFYLINNTQWPVSEEFMTWLLQQIAKQLPQHKIDLKRQVGIVIADLPQMIDLNQKFRKKKGATDVLSFEGGGQFLGDIVVCFEVMSRQAKDHLLDESEELAYLILHGVLHLLGYDHETNKADAAKMFAIQDKIFEVLMDLDILKAYQRKSRKKAVKKKSVQKKTGRSKLAKSKKRRS